MPGWIDWTKLVAAFLFADYSIELWGETMKATIRPARVEDAAGIAKVHIDSWRTTYKGMVPDEHLAGLSSMLVWVLEQNPSRHFYEALGGQYMRSKPIEVGGAQLVEAAYGWGDMRVLLT